MTRIWPGRFVIAGVFWPLRVSSYAPHPGGLKPCCQAKPWSILRATPGEWPGLGGTPRPAIRRPVERRLRGEFREWRLRGTRFIEPYSHNDCTITSRPDKLPGHEKSVCLRLGSLGREISTPCRAGTPRTTRASKSSWAGLTGRRGAEEAQVGRVGAMRIRTEIHDATPLAGGRRGTWSSL